MKIYLHVTYMQLNFSLKSLNLHHYKFLKTICDSTWEKGPLR